MEKRIRNKQGQFEQKSEEYRQVRSLRLTDSTWDRLAELAEQRCITRADLIEWAVSEDKFIDHSQDIQSENESLQIPGKEDLIKLADRSLQAKVSVGSQSKYYKEARKAFKYFIDVLLSQK